MHAPVVWSGEKTIASNAKEKCEERKCTKENLLIVRSAP
jgi:hypothetical protein